MRKIELKDKDRVPFKDYSDFLWQSMADMEGVIKSQFRNMVEKGQGRKIGFVLKGCIYIKGSDDYKAKGITEGYVAVANGTSDDIEVYYMPAITQFKDASGNNVEVGISKTDNTYDSNIYLGFYAEDMLFDTLNPITNDDGTTNRGYKMKKLVWFDGSSGVPAGKTEVLDSNHMLHLWRPTKFYLGADYTYTSSVGSYYLESKDFKVTVTRAYRARFAITEVKVGGVLVNMDSRIQNAFTDLNHPFNISLDRFVGAASLEFFYIMKSTCGFSFGTTGSTFGVDTFTDVKLFTFKKGCEFTVTQRIKLV